MKNRWVKLACGLLAATLLVTLVTCRNQGTVSSTQPTDGEVSSIVVLDELNLYYSDQQWALAQIKMPDAWQITMGSEDVLIAVLDSGIDLEHEDLEDKSAGSVNFTDSPTAGDRLGHGTHVAGIIAASADNELGIAGVAPVSRLLNVKSCYDTGSKEIPIVVEGIIWAVDHGAKVINMSLTFRHGDPALEDAVNYAWEQGAVLICASGNYGSTSPTYPAYYENCLAVTSVNNDGLLGQLATSGDWVDVAAPGVNIYSTLPGNSYGYKSGTSMAAAYVSGLAALLFGLVEDINGNGLLNDEVRFIIEASCDELGVEGTGRGCINALRALELAVIFNRAGSTLERIRVWL